MKMPHIIRSIPVDMSEESLIAKSNPDMIKSARINANIRPEDIEKFYENWREWENGERPTTWEDLRLIAKFYHKPSFYYFLKEPVEKEYLKDIPITELFEELQNDLEEFKKELLDRLELCSHVEINDL